MAHSRSARRYAQAVFRIAQERDKLTSWAEDLHFVSQVLQNQEFRKFLEHAKVPLETKMRAISKVLKGTDLIIQNVLALLVSKGLCEVAPEMELQYRHLLDVFEGRTHVEVYSAVPLLDDEQDRIATFLKDLVKNEVVLDVKIDSSMLGGLIFRMVGTLLDGSTRTRLQQLRKSLKTDIVASNTTGSMGR